MRNALWRETTLLGKVLREKEGHSDEGRDRDVRSGDSYSEHVCNK